MGLDLSSCYSDQLDNTEIIRFLNQARAGRCVPGFLELLLSANVCMRVCLRMCLPPRLLITGGVTWCDIDPT